MSPFHLYVGCGDCGGDVERVTGSPYIYDGPNREHTAVLKCKRCRQHWVFRGELLRAPSDANAAARSRKHKQRVRACDPREPFQRVPA